MEHTKIILVTGDSHTWGQGSGGENALEQPLVPGELRPLSFECPSYVNLLRAKIGTLTGSEALEYQGKALMELAHGRERHGSALLLEGDSLVLPKKASVYRICFQGQEEESRAQVRLGGRCYGECGLSMLASQYMYCFYPVLCQEEEMELEIRCTAGSVLIYRIEAYRGPFAVINGGIGSCPLVRYLLLRYGNPG